MTALRAILRRAHDYHTDLFDSGKLYGLSMTADRKAVDLTGVMTYSRRRTVKIATNAEGGVARRLKFRFGFQLVFVRLHLS